MLTNYQRVTRFSFNLVNSGEKAMFKTNRFDNLVKDAVKQLIKTKEAYIFTEDQLESVTELCNEKGIKFTAEHFDGYIKLKGEK